MADHGDPYDWEDLLPSALFALRTAISRSTGLAPYQILFGRDCSSPMDNIFRGPSDNLDEPGIMDYLRKLRKCVLNAHEYARKHLSIVVCRQRCQYHKERKDLHTGTRVWLFTSMVKKGSSAKLTCYWCGPWIICAEPTSSETLLRIVPDPTWAKQLKNSSTRVVSIDRLKLYNNAKAIRVPECEEDLEMDNNEFAENISIGTARATQPTGTGAPAGSTGGIGGGGSGNRDSQAGKTSPGQGPTAATSPSPAPWRSALQTASSSESSTSDLSETASSSSKDTEKDLLDGTMASQVPGESFLLTPPRFEFNLSHINSHMDTTTPGPTRAAPLAGAHSTASPSTPHQGRSARDLTEPHHSVQRVSSPDRRPQPLS